MNFDLIGKVIGKNPTPDSVYCHNTLFLEFSYKEKGESKRVVSRVSQKHIQQDEYLSAIIERFNCLQSRDQTTIVSLISF